MKTITKNEKHVYFEKACDIIDGHRNMTAGVREQLSDLGFEENLLGTGRSAIIHSQEIETMKITSRKYLNGTFLVVGLSAIGGRMGSIYRGMTMQIGGVE